MEIEYLLKCKKGKNTAYSGKIPSESSKVLKKFGTLSCISMTIMNIHSNEIHSNGDHMNSMTMCLLISILCRALDYVGKTLQVYAGLSILTLSGPAFSVDHQARGGLRGPDAKNRG